MLSLAAGIEGFMLRKLIAPFRIAAIAGGLFLIDPGTWTDAAGLGLIALVIITQILGVKREKSQPTKPNS